MTQSALVVHWGRTGGGPAFTLELVRAMRAGDPGVGAQYNADADVAGELSAAAPGSMAVRTYRDRLTFVTHSWRLLVNGIATRRHVRRHRVDRVVTAMESVYQSLVVPWVLPRGVTYVVVVHDAQEHPGDEHVLKRVGRRFELRRADVVVTLSQSVTDALVRDHGVDASRIRTLFHPAAAVSIAAGRPGPRATPVVGFVGRLLPYKGLDTFVDAARLVRQAEPSARFGIWGDGPEGAAPRGTDLVDWNVGWVAPERLLAVIDSLDVVVLPYAEASQSGIVGLAMARGVPCVVTPVGGLSEQVASGGCGIVAEDVGAEAVAAAVLDVLRDRGTYAALSHGGLAASRTTRSWSAFAAAIAAVSPEAA
ncbi:glycosyl transferase group 1 [Beutenbergia cavernae DSM 12333]|uniref:D-inositol 3-phosphate glycosyltransferase n=1 Tax=Beutenbergia cavernae (strain ATCC BAA-8 / DSM 12333 / CCUG 43141 / JCM 11478 / NBRC 16432 / NCIMB 13614 / HKI 0122) TaxID=471853 RepID=C5C030_BEUC1|nr:glycosyltransferase family 4 protein [Beutenbergia cavernae]ACQ79216.1 glycosyl transferase group 1 [Beutenbergia cavernae DSM 12333]